MGIALSTMGNQSSKGHSGPVNPAQFNHNGTMIVTAGADKTVRVWSMDDEKTLMRTFEEKMDTAVR